MAPKAKRQWPDAGYGSKENYELMKGRGIDAYVKYNQFHKEQKREARNSPFLPQNLFYNREQDFFVCPMGQRLQKVGEGKRISSNGYEATVSLYQARRCEGCPMRAMCHKAVGNRLIEVNHRLNELSQKARELLNGELGKAHRSKRPIEVEAVFGQLKSNNRFNRFTLRGLAKVEIEFGLMAVGHNLRKLATKTLQQELEGFFTCGFGPYSQVLRPMGTKTMQKQLWLKYIYPLNRITQKRGCLFRQPRQLSTVYYFFIQAASLHRFYKVAYRKWLYLAGLIHKKTWFFVEVV